MIENKDTFPNPLKILESPEAANLVALNFRVPFMLRQQLKLQAALLGISMTQLGIEAMQLHLAKLGDTRTVARVKDCKK